MLQNINMPTQKAGAIILSRDKPYKVLLLYRGSQHDWSFPKGHIEAGEDITKAIRREVEEETGLVIEILPFHLPSLTYKHPKVGEVALHFALAQSLDDSRLRIELPGDKLEWTPIEKVSKRLSYQLGDYFKKVLPTILKIDSIKVI